MKIYLDVCAIQRPLDTPDQIRIRIEAEAVLGILDHCEESSIELLSSDALHYEIERCPIDVRKIHSLAVLSISEHHIQINSEVRGRAEKIMGSGITPLDALHLSLAEKGKADYFCTVDDQLLKKAVLIHDLKTRLCNPVDLVQELEK